MFEHKIKYTQDGKIVLVKDTLNSFQYLVQEINVINEKELFLGKQFSVGITDLYNFPQNYEIK